MFLTMIGADHKTAQIELREKISLTESRVITSLQKIKQSNAAQGAVIISTCNRTELYLASREPLTDRALKTLFCGMVSLQQQQLAGSLYIKRDETLIRYLFELSCGLHSMILGDDQIITQVNDALRIATQAKSGTPELNTLFRHAVTCGKKAKTSVVLCSVSPSVVQGAVEIAEEYIREKRRVLVIGNGEMGRLAACLFRDKGCEVFMTLRNYKYTEVEVPQGCSTVPYEQRGDLLETSDIVVSATKSPHHTLTLEMVEPLTKKPAYFFDLAVPRDIDPRMKSLKEVSCYNVDDIGMNLRAENQEALGEIAAIITQQLEKYNSWRAFMRNLKKEVSILR